VVARVKESCESGRVQLWRWEKGAASVGIGDGRCVRRCQQELQELQGCDVACSAVSPRVADVLDLYGLSCDRAVSKLDYALIAKLLMEEMSFAAFEPAAGT
jgi:hypothetical protein